MTEDRADKLLRDLFALLARYRHSEIESAARLLESGKAIELVSNALKSAQNMVPERHALRGNRLSARKKSKTPRERLDEFLSELATKNDSNSQTVRRFIQEVAEGRVLSSAPTLKEYSKRLGLSQDAKFDRRITIRKIGEFLLDQSPEQRNQFIVSATQIGSRKSSLQDWSDIINKDHK